MTTFEHQHSYQTPRARAGALVGLLAAVALALAPAAAASAHDYLVESSPASGAVQTDPLTQVVLTFNDRVLDLSGNGSSALTQVTDASGRHFETGCPTILDRTVTAPVALGAAGAYTVQWQIVSADGHTASGTYSFEYRPGAGASPASGSASAPACGARATTGPVATPGGAVPGAPSPGQSASTSSPAVPTSGGDSSLPLVIGIGVGIVVLALVGVVILLATARRRAPGDDEHEPPAGAD
jgi:hypothetical protein